MIGDKFIGGPDAQANIDGATNALADELAKLNNKDDVSKVREFVTESPKVDKPLPIAKSITALKLQGAKPIARVMYTNIEDMWCETCLYFQSKKPGGRSDGKCRRYPLSAEYGLPKVNKKDWCGEYIGT